MIKISSKNNNIIKDLVKIRNQSRFRNIKSLFYVEGERIVFDIPHNLIEKIFVLENKINEYKDFLNNFSDNQIYVLDDKTFDKIKDTVNSQGIIALVKYNVIDNIKNINLENIKNVLILDNISDPGNLGTIIRISEASNISLIILANNCCSIYNTKVIRACMSSIFRSNIYISENIIEDLVYLKENGYNLYATILDKNVKNYIDNNYKNKNAVIMGNEANGISDDIKSVTDNYIYIPMCGKIESLNVSMATSIICYEIMRQNNFYEVKR